MTFFLYCTIFTAEPARGISFANLAHFIFEIGVNNFPLFLVDELHEIAESLANIFQHRQSDIRPVFILLQIEDQFHLFVDHRDGSLLFQTVGNLFHVVAQLDKRLVLCENG